MNPRIKELAKQAFDKSIHLDLDLLRFSENFAELIVRECAKVATECDMQYKVGWMIKQHFGVEE